MSTCFPLSTVERKADLRDRSLEPVILELEREPADILFVGHASVIRCVLAYLQVRFHPQRMHSPPN